MSLFTPCQGKHACRDDGERCLTCGRTLDEIASLRDSLERLTTLAVAYGYDNIDQYTDYLARKLEKMIAGRRQQEVEVHVAAD